MFSTVLSLLVCSMVLLTSAEDNLEGPAQYCGRALTRKLSIVCDSTYSKRADPVVADNNYLDEDEDYQEPVGVFRSRRSSLSFGPRRMFRERRGVVVECCRKPCTIDELASYCGR